MSILTINNGEFINQGSSLWTIRNNDCGTNSNNVPATINSVSINGVQVGNLTGSTVTGGTGVLGSEDGCAF